ncbi:MAG: hypothetical protein ABIN89_08910 [Chitinophagaceae bacterium]
MKNVLFPIFIWLLCSFNILAQDSKPIRVKAGEDIYQKLAKEIYLYPEFIQGTIYFRNGNTNLANFNYNRMNGEMQFIDVKGDTLSVANEVTIKYINVAKDSFYYSEGYLQLVKGNNAAKVARKQVIKIIDQQKIGAYDQPSSAGAISSYSSLSNDLRFYKLDVRQDVILAQQTTYFFGDKYNNFFRANKKNLLRNFSKKERELNDYLKENNIDFNKEEDLTKLIVFLKDY